MQVEKTISEENLEFTKPRTKAVIINSLQELCHSDGYIYSLCRMLRQDQFFDAEKILDVNWHERINIQEFTLLIGLLIKKEIQIDIIPSEEVSNIQIEKTYIFLEELHLAYNEPIITKWQKEFKEFEYDKLREFQSNVDENDSVAEQIFYGGSGAYDFQYLELTLLKYKADENWLIENKNISLEGVTSISKLLKKCLHFKLKAINNSTNFLEFCKATLNLFCFTKEDIKCSSPEHVESFLKCFALTPSKVNSTFSLYGEYNSFESHPIIKLQENHYFLPIQFLLTQSIYESPFYWMAQDDNYKSVAFKNRGDAAEEISCNFLTTIFGKENVHRNVKVLKSKKEQITDIDILAIAGNKAVIIQAKSKKLTQLSKIGDSIKLREDFKDAVQNAYDQGLLCRKALINKDNKLVSNNGVELNLGEFIDDAYIICVTTDHYPAVISQLNAYLIKKESDPYPLAMNLFDLDVVAFYLKDPFEFLYYLRQRVNLTSYAHAVSEMAYLGSHLKQKLFPLKNIDGEWLDESFAQLIDADFPALRSDSPKTSASGKLFSNWKNEKFYKLLDQVKDSKVPEYTDAIFFLYDISGDGADKVIEAIEKVKRMTVRDGRQHDLSMEFDNGKSGLTFMSFPDFTDRIESKIYDLSAARKYKSKANIWLGIASVINSDKAIDALFFSKEPWQEDNELQKLVDIKLKPGIALAFINKAPSKNTACYCGSGKKYKRCHGMQK